MNLKSHQNTVQKSQKELFDFLTDIANFKNILPDTLEEFESNEDSFKFTLQGMPAVRLKFEEKQEFDMIKLKATSDSFPIFLTCKIESVSDNESKAQLFFDGEINAMMAMMLKKPLQNLLNSLVEKMGKL